MFQLYSKGTEHTLRALIQMKVDAKAFTAREICRKARIPESFTRKMLQVLVQNKILRAIPGPGGGYRLTKNPAQISILNIIESIDGHGIYNSCVMGFSQCNEKVQCPLHNTWIHAKEGILSDFRKMTVNDLSEELTLRRGQTKTRRKGK